MERSFKIIQQIMYWIIRIIVIPITTVIIMMMMIIIILIGVIITIIIIGLIKLLSIYLLGKLHLPLIVSGLSQRKEIHPIP
jgi:hypothetical protein